MEAGARVVRAMEYLGASSTSDGSSNTSSNNIISISSNNSSMSSNNSSMSSNNNIGSSSSGNGSPSSSSSSSSGSGFVACTSLGRRRHGKGVAGGDCEGGEGRWSLPADVLGKIFSLLPVQDVIRAGAVCKWWHSVVSSYEARNGSGSRTMSSAVEGDIYFPVFFSDAHDQSCFGFGIDSKKWRELPPITFLPASDDPDSSSSASQLVCSDKGLLCIEKGGQYYVCNPATKAYKLLPPMICCSDRHRHQAVDVHLQVERDGEAYTLVALCGRVIAGPRAPAWWFPPLAPLVRQAPGRRRLQHQHPQQHGRAQLHQHALAWARLPGARVSCYDSRTNSWTPSPSRPAPVGGLVVAGSVWFRGVVYMLVQGDVAANVSLMAYHVERQTWARIGSVHPFEQESKARLVVVGDHVMAVTLDSKGFLVSSFKPASDMDDAAAAAAAQGQGGQGYEIQFHELFLEEGSEFLRDCTVEGWACVGYQTSIYIVTLRSLKLAVCHVFKKTWLRLQSGSQQCAIRTHLATPLSCPIEVGLRTPV